MPHYPAQKENETRLADFSPCRAYRYHLAQNWDKHKPPLYWLMLNPSTADEKVNDPTVEGCERRARDWGYGGSVVFNIFAYRATDPTELKQQADPVGAENDAWLRQLAELSCQHDVIAAWGEHGQHQGRSDTVRDIFRQQNGRLLALQINQSGEPKHPLYIARHIKPVAFAF